jgi:hypothetical protein
VPFFARFEFIQSGIRVRHEWFPIIKMEWVRGQSLTEYIKEHLNDSDKLNMLADEFKKVVLFLSEHGIAHGDLQHGNIIVQNDGSIRLVDYDGCFVPELSGLKSNELGHRNYQHPRRSAADFNENIDNFSAWLIWLSIKSLAEDPHLWDKLHAGDECLLFRRQDFIRSQYSRAFHLLEMHYNENIRQYGKFLRSLLSRECSEIASLSAAVEIPENLPPLESIIELANAKEALSSANEPNNKEKALPQQIPSPDYLAAKKKIDRERLLIRGALTALIILPTAIAVMAFVGDFSRIAANVKPVPVTKTQAQEQKDSKVAVEPADTEDKRPTEIAHLLHRGLGAYDSRNYVSARNYYQRALDLDNDGVTVLGASDKGYAYMRLADCKRRLNYGDYGAADYDAAHHFFKKEPRMVASSFSCERDAASSALAHGDYEFALKAVLTCLEESSARDYRDVQSLLDNGVYAASKLYEKTGDAEWFRQLWSAVTASRRTDVVEIMLSRMQIRAGQLDREDQEKGKSLWSLSREYAASRPDVKTKFVELADKKLHSETAAVDPVPPVSQD